MSNILTKPYTLSLWRIQPGSDDSNEEKLFTIGSDTMDTQSQAYEVALTDKSTGEVSLSFYMYYEYVDNLTGEKINNPFIPYLKNECLVKLNYDNDWYDFVIKNSKVNTEKHTMQFQLESAPVNELSKLGFDVVLDEQLQNNVGPVIDLARSVIEPSTDWRVVDTDGLADGLVPGTLKSDKICEAIEELALLATGKFFQGATVYKLQISEDLASAQFTYEKINLSGVQNFNCYIPYSNLTSSPKRFQFLMLPEGQLPILNKDNIITMGNNIQGCWIENPEYIDSPDTKYQLPTGDGYTLSGVHFPPQDGTNRDGHYRILKWVSTPITHKDTLVDKYITEYEATQPNMPSLLYRYETTKFHSPDLLVNYITTFNKFSFDEDGIVPGWRGYTFDENVEPPKVKTVFKNSIFENGHYVITSNNETYLRLQLHDLGIVINSGPEDHYQDFKDIKLNQKYVVKCEFASGSTPKVVLVKYKLNNLVCDYINISTQESFDSTGCAIIRIDSVLPLEADEHLGLAFMGSNDVDIKSCEMFQYVPKTADSIEPMLPTDSIDTAYIETIYHYYDPNSPENLNARKSNAVELMEYYHEGNNELESYKAKFDDSCLKRSTITAKESNYFNILQEMCEKFECYVKFHILKDETGKTLKTAHTEYQPQLPEQVATQSGAIWTVKSNINNCYQYISGQYVHVAAGSMLLLQDAVGTTTASGKKEFYPYGCYLKVSKNAFAKYITFHKYGSSPQNHAGFRYGINLKGINRTDDSKNIVTKLIVKPNNNKFAKSATCTIQNAKSNPTLDTAIYNFDYYIDQGLIDGDTLFNELYKPGTLDGFYFKMKELNKLVEQTQDLLNKSSAALLTAKAKETTSEATIAAAVEEQERITDLLYKRTGYTPNDFSNDININTSSTGNAIKRYGYAPISNSEFVNGPEAHWYGSNEKPNYSTTYLVKIDNKFSFLQGSPSEYTMDGMHWMYNSTSASHVYSASDIYTLHPGELIDTSTIYGGSNLGQAVRNLLMQYENAKNAEAKARVELENLQIHEQEYNVNKYTTQLDGLAHQKKLLTKNFQNKFTPFVQEGSWIDNNYTDADVYYQDALSVLYNSCYPKVTYNISVNTVNAIDGYEGYDFKIGELTYIEDPDYFKNKKGNQLYKEKVIITEMTRNLDAPWKDTIKVKNYTTHFKDLFQRMNATVQSLKYASGGYQRAAGSLNAEGNIKSAYLKDAFRENTAELSNPAEQTVTTGLNGLTISAKETPNKVRLIDRGIYLSTDGGNNWTTGITGKGINASVLTAGTVNTSVLQIMNANQPTFYWDANGLTAYATRGVNNIIVDVDKTQGVRFDHNGIYGYKSQAPEWVPEKYEDIYGDNSAVKFALTWDGFMFKTDGADGRVLIDNTNAIRVQKKVNDDFQNKVVLGKYTYGTEPNKVETYGLSIYNDENKQVLWSDDQGNLTLSGIIDTQAGTIGGWNITADKIEKAETGIYSGKTTHEGSPVRFYAGAKQYQCTTDQEYIEAYCEIHHELVANIMGAVNAGGIEMKDIKSDVNSYNGIASAPFKVTADGSFYATKGHISAGVIIDGGLSTDSLSVSDGNKQMILAKDRTVAIGLNAPQVQNRVTIGQFLVDSNSMYFTSWKNNKFQSQKFSDATFFLCPGGAIEDSSISTGDPRIGARLYFSVNTEVRNQTHKNYLKITGADAQAPELVFYNVTGNQTEGTIRNTFTYCPTEINGEIQLGTIYRKSGASPTGHTKRLVIKSITTKDNQTIDVVALVD